MDNVNYRTAIEGKINANVLPKKNAKVTVQLTESPLTRYVRFTPLTHHGIDAFQVAGMAEIKFNKECLNSKTPYI